MPCAQNLADNGWENKADTLSCLHQTYILTTGYKQNEENYGYI